MRRDELEKVIGRHIRNLRIGQGLTQAEVAERANVSLGALKHLESGAGATIHTLVKVLRASVARTGSTPWSPGPARSTRSTSSSARERRAERPGRGGPRVGGRPHGELPAHRRHRGPGLGPAGRRGGPRPRDRLVRLRLHPRVGRRAASSWPRCTWPLREQPYEFPELRRETFYGLPALLADALPDRSATRWSTPGWPSRECAATEHHAAGPPGLCRRPCHGGARVPTAGARRSRRGADRGPTGRPGAGRPPHRARRVRRRRDRPRRPPAAHPGGHECWRCAGQGRGRLQPRDVPGRLGLRRAPRTASSSG